MDQIRGSVGGHRNNARPAAQGEVADARASRPHIARAAGPLREDAHDSAGAKDVEAEVNRTGVDPFAVDRNLTGSMQRPAQDRLERLRLDQAGDRTSSQPAQEWAVP